METSVDFQDMSGATGKKATYADIEALPENHVGQIVDGELFVMGRPSVEHAAGTSMLFGLLMPPFQLQRGGPGGWWILFEPELLLAEDVLVPDIAGWRRAKSERLEKQTMSLAPDWVCETLSPSTATFDRVKKMRVYAREGVGHVWLVDPLAHTLEVFERDGTEWRQIGLWSEQDRVKAPPFEAVEIELGLLWLESGPPAR